MRNHIAYLSSAFAALPVIASASPASATIVAQWNMDETFGTTMTDSSGNGNDGTTYNIVTSGGGYIFNGNSSKAVVPDSPTLNPGSTDFSYTAQVQTDAMPPPNGDYDIIRKGAGSTSGGGYRMEIQTHDGIGKAYCSVSDSAGHTFSIRGTTNVVDNQLHTLVCQKTSTGLTLLVDSLPPRTKGGTIAAISNTKPLAIGVKSPTTTSAKGDWYEGTLRSVSISVEP
jgi:Concanavalin A-like lectin/glucanases superfamily